MLARRASNAFVCVRCELRLARRLPAYARRTSHANFSTSARRHDGAEELEAAASQGTTPGLRITRGENLPERIRKRKGKVLRETSARLGGGITRLGDDADILVLREVGSNAPQQPVEEPKPAEPIVVPDIVASLQQERKPLTPEEIQERLESLRPQIGAAPNEPVYVPLKTFAKLVRNLNKAFTTQQLAQFYSAAKNVPQETSRQELLASLREGTGAAQHPTVRTNWQPGTTPLAKRLPGAGVKIRNKRAPVSRGLLVDQIMRDIWKLVPLEEVEALGELELTLKPWHVTLLNAGDEETILTNISATRKARIEVYQPHNVLRITADKTTADYAANDIEEALRKHITSKLQLKTWIPHLEEGKAPADEKLATLYSDEDFRIVTNVTRASIQRMDNANTLVIRGFSPGANAEAERALLRLLPLKDTATRTIDTQEIEDRKSQVHLLPASFEGRSLEVRHQSANLGRWTSPVGRRVDAQVPHGQDVDVKSGENVSQTSAAREHMILSIIQKLRDSLKERRSTAAKDPKKSPQSPFENLPKFKLSANFGQALFPMPDTASARTSPVSTSSSARPLFTSSVPGLASLMSPTHVHGTVQDEQLSQFRFVAKSESPSLLLYDFIPAPAQTELKSGQTPPSLHIQMRTGGKAFGEKANTALHELSLGFQEHVHTVLLPDSATDVQFTRYGRLHLDSSTMKLPILDWITDVHKNINSGERLTAPDITIPVPHWAITGNPADLGVKKITYLFSAVQLQQVIEGRVMDEFATYSSTQSSKLAAQGGALAMHYRKDVKSVEKLLQGDDNRLTSFVENSLRFADAVTEAAGQAQPIAKILRPRNTESGRKHRRLEEQAAAAVAEGTPGREQPEDDVLDLLDDAVAGKDQEQSQDTISKPGEEFNMHGVILTEEPAASEQELTPLSSDRSVSEDTADTPSLETSEKPSA
ncbi:hypothetical protein HBH47_217740 [Parastagonospora nodorum]|nr:hypothetical protein HBH47_217740 [Parastagonospora nodorum]